MRTTITISDELFEKAAAITGEKVASSVITKALEALVTQESKRRILSLSGKAPTFNIPARTSRSQNEAPTSSQVAESDSEYKS